MTKTRRNFVGLAQSQFIYFKFLGHSRCSCLSRFLPSDEWQAQVPCQIGALPSSTPACPGIPVFIGAFWFWVLLFCCRCFLWPLFQLQTAERGKAHELTHGRLSWCTPFHPRFFSWNSITWTHPTGRPAGKWSHTEQREELIWYPLVTSAQGQNHLLMYMRSDN